MGASITTGARGSLHIGGHAPGQARAAVVCWEIARAALVRSRPGLVSPGSDAPVLFELRVNGTGVEAVVRDGTAEVALETPAHGPARWIDDGEFTHIEATGLSLTLRGGDVVYARSTALSSLGLPGGRAEVDRA